MIWIYISGIIIITIVVFIFYYISLEKHNKEIKKIETLEQKINNKKKDLEEKRSKTTECPTKNLNDPRSCYFKSNYSCSWNEDTERCEKMK